MRHGRGTGALNLWLTALLSRVQVPAPVPIQFLIEPDWRLLSYSMAVAVVSTLVSGLMPALRGAREGITIALKQHEHQVGRRRWTLRNALVAGQLAVSVVLLCASFLFLRNLVQASTMVPGFDADHTLWTEMRLVPEQYSQPEQSRALIREALDRLRTLPGVESASIARRVPLNDSMTTGTDLHTDRGTVHVRFNQNYVGPDYFRTMGIRMVEGREFLASDRSGAPRVAIMNENMARRLFGNSSAVGRAIRFSGGEPIEIAGVARNSKYYTLGEENVFAYYEPHAQGPATLKGLHFLVRASGAPEPLVPAINTALGKLDPTAALETKTMRKALAFALLPSRVGAAILGSVGLLALALAAIGLYGLLLYTVGRRTREIGLRVALGATPGGVLRMVLAESGTVAAVGVCAGLLLAVFAVRPLAMFLVPEVHPTDAANFIVVAGVLCAVALAATLSPALRALRVDPAVALRHE